MIFYMLDYISFLSHFILYLLAIHYSDNQEVIIVINLFAILSRGMVELALYLSIRLFLTFFIIMNIIPIQSFTSN
jgi:hypothetical protein